MWTKSVLMLAAGAVGLLLLLELLPLDYIHASPLAPPRESVFEGLGPAVKFWIFLLGVALVRDYVVSRRDRSIVRSFGKRLNPESLEDDSVTQGSDQNV